MNDRAYPDDHIYVAGEPEPLPGDPVCPTCRKVTSVQRVGALWWCGDCDVAFNEGDVDHVNPEWAAKYRERREQGYAAPLPVQSRKPSREAS